jgi:hypothetical protein
MLSGSAALDASHAGFESRWGHRKNKGSRRTTRSLFCLWHPRVSGLRRGLPAPERRAIERKAIQKTWHLGTWRYFVSSRAARTNGTGGGNLAVVSVPASATVTLPPAAPPGGLDSNTGTL